MEKAGLEAGQVLSWDRARHQMKMFEVAQVGDTDRQGRQDLHGLETKSQCSITPLSVTSRSRKPWALLSTSCNSCSTVTKSSAGVQLALIGVRELLDPQLGKQFLHPPSWAAWVLICPAQAIPHPLGPFAEEFTFTNASHPAVLRSVRHHLHHPRKQKYPTFRRGRT